MHMVITGFFGWWYGAGWRRLFVSASERVASFYDYFSIDLMLKTFFSPFRQISAGSVQGTISMQMRALFDQILSRLIGATVRLIMIFIGIVTIGLAALYQFLKIIVWPLVPILPALGLVVALIGWTP